MTKCEVCSGSGRKPLRGAGYYSLDWTVACDCAGVAQLKTRVAEALGWTPAEAESFSWASLRELLPQGALRDEVSRVIRSGEQIRG